MNDKQIANLRADLLQKIRASGADVEEIRQALTELAGDVETCAHQLDIAPAFSTTENYVSGDLVYNEGALYQFTTDHNEGAWTGEDVELTDIAILLDDLSGDISDLQPVDSVTNGEQKAVTSNAVYDYENEYAEVVAVEGDTRKTLYNKLNTIVDWSKVGRNSHLVSGSGYSYFYAGGHNFLLMMQTYSDNNVVLEIDKAALDNSNSTHRMVFYRTGVGSGSFSSITGTVDDYSNTEVPAGQKYRVYYR